MWIIENFLDSDQAGRIVLASDRWPTEDKEGSGYRMGVKVQSSIPQSAGFERPLQEAAEVHRRLERTNGAGLLLLAQIQAGKEFKEMAHDAKCALLYCCGRAEKGTSFRQWKWAWEQKPAGKALSKK